MKAGLLKALFLMIAVSFAATARAGESGGVTRPPSIPSGNLHQGYHPLGINFYSGYLANFVTLEIVLHDTVSLNVLEADVLRASPIVPATSTQGVPEPSSAVLSAAAIAFIAARRGRRRG